MPFSFGSVDNTVTDIRAVIVSDNAYLSDGIASIFKDCHFRRFALITPPLDARQAYTGATYNYAGLASGQVNRGPLIQKVRESKLLKQTNEDSKDDLQITYVDFEISQVRSH